jgi:RHS repeat-associated protein
VQAAQHKTLFLAAMLILGVPPLAAHTHVAQNSRLGLDTFKTSLHQEIELGSSLKALEIDASVRRTCVRSRNTGKERDAETGLDYFGARYLSSAQGQFTSPDPLLSSGRPWDPQSWNRYSYVLNNPLRYTDPLGLYVWDGSLGGDTTDDEVRKNYAKKQANQIIGRRNDIRGALAAGAKINNAGVQAAIAAYGTEGKANGVAVAMGKLSGNTAAQVGPGNPPMLASPDGQSVTANMIVTFDFSKVSGANDLVVNAAHEGQHMVDRQAFTAGALAPGAFDGPLNLTTYQTEVNAYTTGAAAFRALNPNSGYSVGGQLLWNPGWAAVDRQALDKMLAVPKPKGSYGVTPNNPGSVLYPK